MLVIKCFVFIKGIRLLQYQENKDFAAYTLNVIVRTFNWDEINGPGYLTSSTQSSDLLSSWSSIGQLVIYFKMSKLAKGFGFISVFDFIWCLFVLFPLIKDY